MCVLEGVTGSRDQQTSNPQDSLGPPPPPRWPSPPPLRTHTTTLPFATSRAQADLGTGKPPTTPGELAYAELFRSQTVRNATADTITPALPGTAAMLPACYKHCNTETSMWATLLTNGVSLEAAVTCWFLGSTAVPPFIVDSCKGFNCGVGCPTP